MPAAYEFVSREFTYHIDDDRRLNYIKRIHLRAARDGLRSYIDKVAWTGGRTGLPECVSDADCKLQPQSAHGMWDYFRVDFGQPLDRAQEIAFELHWLGLTNWSSSRPFVSTSTREPAHRIRFDLRIPRELRSDDGATFEILPSPDAPEALSSESRTFGPQGRLSWQLDQPPLNRHFRINWRWCANVADGSFSARQEPVGMLSGRR